MWISKKDYEKIIKDVEHLYNMIAKDTDIRPHLNYDYNFDLLMGGNEIPCIEGDDLFTIAYKVERISSLNKKIEELEAEVERLKKQLDGKETKLQFVVIHCVSENKDNKEQDEVDVKPTYFTENEKHQCFDLCEIINNGIKIGSSICQSCEYNKGYDLKENWVKCSEMPEGKPKQGQEPKQPERFKRDEFGVISICNVSGCSSCIYIDQDGDSIECSHCLTSNNINEYYSSN